MLDIKGNLQDNTMVIALAGRIDSSNASQAEEEINSLLADYTGDSLCVNMQGLEYISSAGLRILLRLRRAYSDLCLTNVSSEVYEILHMTGFTEMMTVRKEYRHVSRH